MHPSCLHTWTMQVGELFANQRATSPMEQRVPATEMTSVPLRAVALRLFVTCWIIYAAHFATNFTREHYLAVALAEKLSFRVDEYLGFLADTDIFDVPGRGAHIGGNPGASMLGAIPLFVAMPAINAVNRAVVEQRSRSSEPPGSYNDPRPNRRRFYAMAWVRGWDVKFALVGAITAWFLMAPVSALAVVVMYRILQRAGAGRSAIWLSLVYAFGTPAFFRAGLLNQNSLAASFALFAFAILFCRPNARLSVQRLFWSGACTGIALLNDYSAMLIVVLMGCYAATGSELDSLAARFRALVNFGLGALGPVLLLLFYQYESFGHPLYPGQYYMARPEWLPAGYPNSGFGWPTWELTWRTLFDHRYGLFAFCPLLVMGFAGWMIARRRQAMFDLRTHALFLAMFVGFWMFFSSSQYTLLTWNTGLRYLIPAVPFLYLATCEGLVRLPRGVVYFVVLIAIAQSWCIAMVREDVLQSIAVVVVNGFQLPWLTVYGRMGGQYGGLVELAPSPVAVLVFVAALVFGIWRAAAGPQWHSAATGESQTLETPGD